MKSKIFILCLCFFCINSVTSQSYTPTTTVETPFRSIVKDTGIFTSQDDIYSSSELAYYKKILNDNYNGATMIDIPTRTYNCHAYAWHVSEGGNKVWIGLNPGTKAEHVYWTDGSYIEVSESGSTKVSYHESGNHSAIRLGNGWYQSKWGRGPLVKHHLNDVPLGYNPNMPKKFYKKRDISIIGQTFICSFEDYSVSYLPSGATVNWTYTPVYSSNTPSIQQNTPSANSCTVKNTYSQFFEGYLNAEIKISGKIVKKISKIIRGDTDNFVGFYWQPSSDGSWVPDMSISLEEPNIAFPPNDIIIESDNFRGKCITCTALGYTSILTNSASNRVSFEMPSLPSGELLTVRVEGSDCGSPITFTFVSQNYYKSRNERELNITSLENDRYNISVDWSEITGSLASGSNRSLFTTTEIPKWSLEVHNAMNTQRIMEQKVVGYSYILDLSTLNPGIYVVSAIIRDKIYTGKIYKQ